MGRDFDDDTIKRLRRLAESEPELENLVMATKITRIVVLAVAGIIGLFGFDQIASFFRAHWR